MCGRYSLTIRKKDIVDRFEVVDAGPDIPPRYNIAPTQHARFVAPAAGGRRLAEARWGLPAPWDRTGRGLINARAETLPEKALFRRLLDSRRCAVPADGFYEWQAGGGRKRPWHFSLTDGALFAFAGLWDETPGAGPSFLILTTTPNPLVATVHNRMPVILRPEQESRWLDPRTPFASLDFAWRAPFPADAMRAAEVGRAVNDVRTDSPACLAPPPPPQRDLF